MKKHLMTLMLTVAILGAVVAPSFAHRVTAAQLLKSHAASFDKTRFALHLGVAFFAVHHVYKRYQAGALLKLAAPVLGNPANRNRAIPLTYEQFRFGFANAVSEDEAEELFKDGMYSP